MSIVGSNILAGSSGSQGYQISRSVRLRSSASAYFNRTPASAGNRKTWTWSGWVKRGALSTGQIFAAGVDNNDARLGFSGNKLNWISTTSGATSSAFVSLAEYRDPSAWYHIVLAFDTTQATSANRIKMYVNGVAVASDTGQYTAPTLNSDNFINNNIQHYIGRFWDGSYFDGYLTEVNFIDGQALTPSSFGETNSITGVWQPKKYAGTYGTNGFYLNFSDNSAATATTIGKDYSGNGNNWTPNNISVTAGATYDSMIDVPTPYADGGNGRGNYAVLNAVYKDGNTGFTLQDGNLRQNGTGSPCGAAVSTIVPDSGKWYCEFSVGSANYVQVGVVDLNTAPMSGSQMTGANKITWDMNGVAPTLYVNSGSGTGYTSLTTGDVGMIAFDVATRNVWFGKNGTWLASGNPSGGTNAAGAVGGSSSSLLVAVRAESNWAAFNFGQQPFTYTPPTGFKALNTQNLPDATIKKGGDYFNALTWTGDGTSPRSITGLQFQPDFVWEKSRANASSHNLYDVIRGTGNAAELQSNNTGTEGGSNNEMFGYLSSFLSNGFQATQGSSGWVYFNENAKTYAAWCWKANGSGVTNTAGSITSTVSSNTTSGFSIVTYTGTGANATVGHGLGVAPKMIIVKERNAVSSWIIAVDYGAFTWSSDYFQFDTGAKYTNAAGTIFRQAPTSSVFSVGTNSNVNGSTNTFVAYCFAEVANYSKFGSYTGNGSSDGPFVFTNFRPRFVFWKNASTTGDWQMKDAARSTYNVTSANLYANLSNAENSAGDVDFLSNGFKIRSVGTDVNGSGNTIIYAAFAENPFKYSLAR